MHVAPAEAAAFSGFIDLAGERLGGAALAANDEFFAGKENLLKPRRRSSCPSEYTDRGKWMDGWETRRRRDAGHDWCIVRLGLPGVVRGVVVDTAHFLGNFPASCSIEACDGRAGALGVTHSLDRDAWARDPARVAARRATARTSSRSRDARRFTHLRLNIYPDGGVARLRVYGERRPRLARALAAGRAESTWPRSRTAALRAGLQRHVLRLARTT